MSCIHPKGRKTFISAIFLHYVQAQVFLMILKDTMMTAQTELSNPEDENLWVQWSTDELLIKGCMYWADFSNSEHSDNQSSVTVRIEKKNVINQDSLLSILEKIAKEEWS